MQPLPGSTGRKPVGDPITTTVIEGGGKGVGSASRVVMLWPLLYQGEELLGRGKHNSLQDNKEEAGRHAGQSNQPRGAGKQRLGTLC